MQTIKNRSIAGTAALIATVMTLALSTAPARAETMSVPVTYGDLNIHSEAGAAALRSRIGHAAELICGKGDVTSWARTANCRRDAMKAAQAQIAQKTSRSDVQLAAR